ncbi:hypothetical protein TTHERM_01212870 (macronuclear) [Tetrahymena thermophila SB210]|uniref:Uncharacterized protein n=1 Tax=Tetrahymena thermophila (strain SB210) TaxID=312017 RepID=Q24G79_TETTS|nr:hypothetical protein TTHERM_01212870 [Tetrahymena thermophila SB210]EAS06774.1 hypothetical protein TTHERM_01212870 [Tetrahymena thermophila SB210]|eukprot:XP_001027016.1 hypothetical protein TTHERM_01212870 [Tetrahymena thermophila SB210]
MSDQYIQDTELITSETDTSLNYNLKNVKAKDKYPCFVLQNSVNFNNLNRDAININARKSSAMYIGRSLNMSIASQSTLATSMTRRTSIQTNLIRQKNYKQILSQSDIDSCNFTESTNTKRVYAQQNSVIMNQIDNFIENNAINQNNQQDDAFLHIIKNKLNSKQRFEDIYGTNGSSQRDRQLKYKSKNQVRSSQLNEYCDRSSQGSSDCSTGCITGDQSHDNQVSNISEYQSLKQNPPLPQAEVKEKQFRSKSVLASAKLPQIKTQNNVKVRDPHIFNQKKNSSPQIVKYNSQQKQISCSFLEEQDSNSSINQIQFNSPQKLRSQSKYQTPNRGDSNRKLIKQGIKIEENSFVAQEYFKLISGKEDSQHLQFIRINRNQIKQYLCNIYDSHSAELLMSFVDLPQIISFQNLISKIEQFANCSNQEFCLFAFLIYDINNDGYICNQDLYNRWKASDNQMGQEDVNHIVRYAQYQLNNREQANQTIKLLRQQQIVKQDLDEFASDQNEDNEAFELENSIVKGNKHISLQRYRQLKSKKSMNIPEIQSRQYTYYLKSFQVQEHYSNQRLILDEIGNYKHIEKSIVCKKVQYNKLTGDFNLNFQHFCEIFRTEAPKIVYDMIASLTGYMFNDIHYPYSEQQNFQQKMMTFQKQQIKQSEQQQLNKYNLLENKSLLKHQLEQKSNMETYKIQFSQMLSNKQ